MRATWLVLVSALTSRAAAQHRGPSVAYGTVRDTAGAALGGAYVAVVGTTLRTQTDAAGHYRFDAAPPGPPVPPGRWVVRAAWIGFAPASHTLELASGDSARLDFALVPSPVSLAPLEVTTFKVPQLGEAAVTSVAEVTDEELGRRAVNTVDQAVDKAPGVQFIGGQVNLRGSSGFVQGLNARVLLLVDGVPANQGDRGGINWDLLPVDQIERVEILKGAGSSLYGSAALGGVVNVISREIPVGRHARVRATGGAYQNPPHEVWRFRDFTGTHGGLDVTGSYGTDALRGSLAAGGRHSDGYREQDRRDHWQLAGKGEWRAAPLTRLAVSGAWASDQYQVPLLWCTRGQCDDRGQAYQPFAIDTSGLGAHTRSDKGYLTAVWFRTPSARFAWQARGSWLRTHFMDFQPGGNDASVANRFGLELRGEAHPTQTRAVTVGAEGAHSDVGSNIFGNHTQSELAAYGESQALSGRVRMTAGARIDFLAVDGGSPSAVVSPRVGGVLPSRLGAWRASIGRGFRAPSIAERFVRTTAFGFAVIPNPNLHPETAWSVEIGNAAPLASWARLDAALFWTEARDLIEPALVAQNGAPTIQLRNVTRARIAGLDLAAAATPLTPRLTTTLAYTYLYARQLAEATTPEQPLAFRPAHLVTLGADYVWGAFVVGGDLRYMSRIERIELELFFGADRRVAAKVLDVRAGYRRGPLEARLRVNNALNYIYNIVPRTLEPVRTASVTVTWTY